MQMNRQECWDYLGNKGPDGYGRLHKNYKRYRVHRIFYEMFVGDIPEGLVIDHLCRNTSCINPSHLEPVTSRENSRRGIVGEWQKAKHIVQGDMNI